MHTIHNLLLYFFHVNILYVLLTGDKVPFIKGNSIDDKFSRMLIINETTGKSFIKISHQGFMYHNHHTNNGITKWPCDKISTTICRARFITKNSDGSYAIAASYPLLPSAPMAEQVTASSFYGQATGSELAQNIQHCRMVCASSPLIVVDYRRVSSAPAAFFVICLTFFFVFNSYISLVWFRYHLQFSINCVICLLCARCVLSMDNNCWDRHFGSVSYR